MNFYNNDYKIMDISITNYILSKTNKLETLEYIIKNNFENKIDNSNIQQLLQSKIMNNFRNNFINK
jgi:hypothetical protein